MTSPIRQNLFCKEPPGIRLPTLTGKTINSLQLSSTNNLGRFVGRNVPWLGWVMTFTTIYDIQRELKIHLIVWRFLKIAFSGRASNERY